jgi:hypothetical protein
MKGVVMRYLVLAGALTWMNLGQAEVTDTFRCQATVFDASSGASHTTSNTVSAVRTVLFTGNQLPMTLQQGGFDFQVEIGRPGSYRSATLSHKYYFQIAGIGAELALFRSCSSRQYCDGDYCIGEANLCDSGAGRIPLPAPIPAPGHDGGIPPEESQPSEKCDGGKCMLEPVPISPWEPVEIGMDGNPIYPLANSPYGYYSFQDGSTVQIQCQHTGNVVDGPMPFPGESANPGDAGEPGDTGELVGESDAPAH